MKRDCRKANKHSPDSLNTQLLAQNNLPTIWVIGKRQWLKHGLQSCTCTFRRHQLVLQIFKPAIQSLISTNSHLAERPWCSVGSTRRKAHQSLERLGRSQCFSLMTCCERPAFRTKGWPPILFSSKNEKKSLWGSSFSPGLWFSSIWHHSHVVTTE